MSVVSEMAKNRAFGPGNFKKSPPALQYKYRSDIETKPGWISKSGKRQEPVYTGDRRSSNGVYYGGRMSNNGPVNS